MEVLLSKVNRRNVELEYPCCGLHHRPLINLSWPFAWSLGPLLGVRLD